ncbi:hypothetical protein LO749_09465 [Paracoccus denitrificans]|uniref:hypothetical protein n=1 Tax=Paracoccus denitrificans TaxID=266 RepID=UPI001E4AE0FD|nr:hypothetical protein [Paracoccus denitrificans]UFS64396.1 hypothetical protein LO749_09465 [Paracoccus denitrificans]
MANVRGDVILSANGKKYRLWLGMSVLADIQAKYGQDALDRLEPPENAGKGWMPPLDLVTDLFLGALQRHHGDEADRWLVDDLMAQNEGAFGDLMAGSNPDPAPAARGKGAAPKRGR